LTVSLRGTREVKDKYQIFRLTGLLDAFSEPTFCKVIEGYVEQGPKDVIISKKAKTEGGSLQIVTNPRVTQTVKLVRLEKFFSLQPTLEAAIEYLEKA